MRIIGIILLALGIIALTYQGITYTRHKEVLDIAGLKVETKEEKHIPLPPIIGALAVIGGIVLILVDPHDRKTGSP